MGEASYNQFCPVAMASEVLCTRWTLLLLRELLSGSSRFNDLRRGLPRMSPALLSKRLKELEAAGILTRSRAHGAAGVLDYRLTEAGHELKPIVEAIGLWGHRWIEQEASLTHLDVNLLMWDIRRNIDATPLPMRRTVIQFIYSDLSKAQRDWWLVIEPHKEVDLCSVDPGFDVDLYVSTGLKAMTEVWMGYRSIERAEEDGALTLTGSKHLKSNLKTWLRLSAFAKVEKLVA